MLKTTLVAVSLWATSLTGVVATLAFGEFGAPLWIILLMLLWLVTVGAPSTAAVLAVIWSWPGGSFLAFLGLVGAAALVAQIGGVWFTARLWQRLRRKSNHDHPT
jgi:hypothetical protein